MATLNIGDVVQVVQTWTAPIATIAQNVWHLTMVSGAGADSDLLLPQILTQQQTAFAFINQDIEQTWEVTLHELYAYDFVTHRFNGIDSQVATGMPGINATDFLPHGVAMVGRILTDVPRRQGRTFVPGFADSAVTDGLMTPAVEAFFAGYLATFDTDISVTGGLFSWCTFSVDPTSIYYETTALAIQSVIANSIPGYQGRRKPGVGI